MELSRLRALVAVVQQGSFTRAAERMRSQKAQVSRQVSELEAELGVRLLERTTRALRLTEIGREVFERAVGILAAIEETERTVQSARGEPQGVLRITMPLEFGLIAGFGWVRDVLASHPQLRIDVDSSSRIVDLVHEGFDLAIRVGELPDSRLAARRLGEMRYGLYASPTYLRDRGAPSAPNELAGHDLIAFAPGGKPSPLRLHRDEDHFELPNTAPRLRVDSRFAQCDATVAGLGIGENAEHIVAPHLASGALVRVLPEWRRPPVPVHAVFPSHRFLAPKVRTFVEHAQAHFPAADA